MKNIKEMLDAVTEPIKLGDSFGFSNFLTEESDFEETKIITEEDDPFAAAGGDAGGALQPLALCGSWHFSAAHSSQLRHHGCQPIYAAAHQP